MFLSWNLGTLGRFLLSFNKNNLYVFLMYLWNIHEQRRALRDVDHLNIWRLNRCAENHLTLCLQPSVQSEPLLETHICSEVDRNDQCGYFRISNKLLRCFVLIMYTNLIWCWTCDPHKGCFFFFLFADPTLSPSLRRVKLHWWYLPQEEHCVTLLALTPARHPWLNTGRTFPRQDYTI